jgi:hypothetical protein
MGALVRAQVALDDADVEPLEALAAPGGEVVKDADVVALGQETAHEMMAYEPPASCDECAHHLLLDGRGFQPRR